MERMSPELLQRYEAAMHGIQSAVAYEIATKGENGAAADPKHLRVGINSCFVDAAALADLLIAKGLFTRAEYFEAVVRCAEKELERYSKLYAPIRFA